MAAPTGQTEWIQDWPPGPCADPGTGLRLVARRLVGWTLAWSSQHAAAPSALIPVAREASRLIGCWPGTRSRPRSPTSQGNPRECRRSERPRAARRRGAAILDPARAEHALAELHAHERLEVGPGGGMLVGAAAAQEGVGLPHGDEQVVRGSGRAVLGVQVPLDGAEERFGPSGSMNREVKHSLWSGPLRQRTDQRFGWIARRW